MVQEKYVISPKLEFFGHDYRAKRTTAITQDWFLNNRHGVEVMGQVPEGATVQVVNNQALKKVGWWLARYTDPVSGELIEGYIEIDAFEALEA